MKKTTIMLILGMALMLLVAGCASSAESSQYDYVPYAGQGCGLSADTIDTPFVAESAEIIEANSFL